MLSIAPTTEMTAYSSNEDEDSCLGSVAIVTRDHISAATFMAWHHTDWSFIPPGRNVDRNIIQGNLLTGQRNECVQRMKGDWLLFIDDDMVWGPADIGRLVASQRELDADIIGGLCFQRSAPYNPTLFMRESKDEGMYNFLERWDSDVVEVDATGMAFVLIHRRVFEMIIGAPMPSLAVRKAHMPFDFFRWQGVLGEDLRFCQDAKAAGARIFVDTRIEIGHVAEIEVRHRHFLLEALARPEAVFQARRELNDEMGFPTLEPEEIERRLGIAR